MVAFLSPNSFIFSLFYKLRFGYVETTSDQTKRGVPRAGQWRKPNAEGMEEGGTGQEEYNQLGTHEQKTKRPKQETREEDGVVRSRYHFDDSVN